MAATGKNIQRAVRLLSAGKLVAIPTETVYGLAANALDTDAVEQIFAVKNRPHFNPLIMHIGSSTDLTRYVKEVPVVARKLMEIFWPGPLTLLLPKKDIVPDIITASLPHVAIRVPDHPVTLELLRELDFPLAAPSANPFCYISPTRPEHVQKQIGEKIAYILNGGNCERGVESTIVGFENDTPVIFRLGAITPEEIEAVAGKVKINRKSGQRPSGPGMLPCHYAPKTPLFLTDEPVVLPVGFHPDQTGLITFSNPIAGFPEEHLFTLSGSGNLQEAAANLYHALHQLDALNLKRIVAEKLPEEGLGKTLNERLRKAAGRSAGKPLEVFAA